MITSSGNPKRKCLGTVNDIGHGLVLVVPPTEVVVLSEGH